VVDATHAKLDGDLTIRDITHEVTLTVEYSGQSKSPWGTTSAGFSASTRINRSDWNLNWNQALETGGLLVGTDINISIELEIVKQPDAQAAQAA
jgi:polyisoprenoid-binding protein YceI